MNDLFAISKEFERVFQQEEQRVVNIECITIQERSDVDVWHKQMADDWSEIKGFLTRAMSNSDNEVNVRRKKRTAT